LTHWSIRASIGTLRDWPFDPPGPTSVFIDELKRRPAAMARQASTLSWQANASVEARRASASPRRFRGRLVEVAVDDRHNMLLQWMAATLDGIIEQTGAVFEAKFMLPCSFSEEGAAEKCMPQLQHNMWVTNAATAVLSIITGGGKWVEITIPADSLYQHLLLTAEKKFWRCVENGDPPKLFFAETPRARLEAIRIVDMTSSNAWAEFAALYCRTRTNFVQHESAKAELKALMPEDAREAIGHGVRAKRADSGPSRTVIPTHRGQRSGDCGQLLMSV
jgi:hypothetical protein